MKIRYFKGITERRVRRNIRKLGQRNERRIRIAKWHKQFAWLPLKMSTPNDSKHTTLILFETVMQKGRITNAFGEDMPRYDKTTWTRHTEKEYFRKKLDGTLEREEHIPEPGSFTHDGTNMSFQGSGASGVSTSKVIKKGGPVPGPSK